VCFRSITVIRISPSASPQFSLIRQSSCCSEASRPRPIFLTSQTLWHSSTKTKESQPRAHN
jgi:hypothetical protein